MHNMQIRLYGVAPESIVDGPGLRYALFTQGCPHGCAGCHNPGSHDPHAGYNKDISSILHDIYENPLLSGVTFSGGEPFLQAKALCELGRALKNTKTHITTFTGYTLEALQKLAKDRADIAELLHLTDMLIDGPYIAELYSEDLIFRGSSNQGIWCKDAQGWRLQS